MASIKLIIGPASQKLGQKIARYLKKRPTPYEYTRFADGEIYVRVKEKVRGDDVFVIQSLNPPVNENLMTLLILIDTLKRASAGRINALIPYLAYSRQDRKTKAREPITAKLMANLISIAGAQRIITVDAHAPQIQGFYDIPFDHFIAYPKLIEYLEKKEKLDNPIIVAPDVGGLKKAREIAMWIKTPMAFIDKRRTGKNYSKAIKIIGEVKGKTAILIDDIIDTGGTICHATNALYRAGVKAIYICATHGLLNNQATETLQRCPAKMVLLADTIEIPKEKKFPKLKIVSLAKLLSKVIYRINHNQSLGALFDWEKN